MCCKYYESVYLLISYCGMFIGLLNCIHGESGCVFCSECLSKCDMPSLYPHAKGILHALKDKGIDIAVASRSPTPDKANTFLEKLGIKSFFVAQVS